MKIIKRVFICGFKGHDYRFVLVTREVSMLVCSRCDRAWRL